MPRESHAHVSVSIDYSAVSLKPARNDILSASGGRGGGGT